MNADYQQKNDIDYLRLRLRKRAAKREAEEAKKTHGKKRIRALNSSFVSSPARAVELLTPITGAEAAAFAREIASAPFDKQSGLLADAAHCDERDARLILARADYLYFCKYYFPHAFSADFSERFHGDYFDVLHNVETHLVTTPTACVAPRDVGKSTGATLALPTHAVAFPAFVEQADGTFLDLSKRYGIFLCATQRLASKPLRRLAFEFEHNERYIEDFGDKFRDADGRPPSSRAWSRTEIVLASGETFEALGRFGHHRGATSNENARVDLLIGDDLDEDKRSRSITLRRDDVEFVQKVLLNMVSSVNGNALFIGTFLHTSAPLAQLMEFGKTNGWQLRVYPIYTDTPKGREYLWESRYGEEWVQKKLQEIPQSVFDQEYRGIASSGQRDLSWEDVAQHYYNLSDIEDMLRAGTLRITLGVDPACRTKDKNDFTAMVPLAMDKRTGVMYVLPALLDRLNHPAKVSALVNMQVRWNPVLVCIETVQYQIALREAVQEYAKREHVTINTFDIESRGEKHLRLSRLNGSIRSGRIRFLRNDKTHQMIIEQQINLGEGHDDGPDALEMALQGQEKLSARKKAVNTARAYIGGYSQKGT